MNQKGIWNKILAIGLGSIVILSVMYFIIAAPQLKLKYHTEVYSNAENVDTLGEFVNHAIISQKISINADYIKGISVEFANYGNLPKGTVNIEVTDSSGESFAEETVDAEKLPDSSFYYVSFNGIRRIQRGTEMIVTIKAEGGEKGAAVTLWSSNKFNGCELLVNGEETDKTIIMEPDEYVKSNFEIQYWMFIVCLAIGLIGLCMYQIKKEQRGIITPLTEFTHIFDKYKFLLSQLVGKEFKNKYRRSYLGIVWSLLNPFLMMVIVASVFSFIFRFDIDKFPVYLILGQITFNFFSEATQVSVSTIVGSGQLIKKVYLPKYIFPLSKVFFSFVNFLISFIAAFIVMAYYGVRPNINMLFLPVWLINYFVFTLGVGLFLSALMVFLRDTQHLYSLVIVAFGYLTPIFYPVSALAPWMRQVMNLNPLYHFITYLRNIMLYGQCPSLLDNVVCFVCSLVSITVGMSYFFKKQKEFILYI